jgi:hypothetical protein
LPRGIEAPRETRTVGLNLAARQLGFSLAGKEAPGLTSPREGVEARGWLAWSLALRIQFDDETWQVIEAVLPRYGWAFKKDVLKKRGRTDAFITLERVGAVT